MKRFYTSLTLFMFLIFFTHQSGFSQNAWINEIHYDNASGDVNEFIEVVVENPGSYDLSLLQVILHNGSGGASYNTKNLTEFTVGATVGNFTIYHFIYPTDGIQNGAPDGMALVYSGSVIAGQFLSYEGAFTAVGGPANGLLSTDIGVSEGGTTPIGFSLQLSGTGTLYSSFTWQSPADDTPGQLNNGQTLGAPTTPVLTAVPLELSGFTYTLGIGPSASQSYSISGSNLTPASGNISVTGSTNYEVSTDNLTFNTSATLPYTGGTLGATTIYVRLKAGLGYGDYNGEIIANAGGGATTVNVTCNGTVPYPEPSNHVTNFLAGTPTSLTIPLTWTDATGAIIPTGYLVKAGTTGYGNITAPVDFVPETDGTLVKNVAAGVGAVNFTGLVPGQLYYFKIWPYTNSGAFIDYKTDGTVPQQDASTDMLYFRSVASGAWNAAATWEISVDDITYVPATTEIPIYGNSDVTIRNGHTVTVPTGTYNNAAEDLTVESGATLYANSSSSSCFVYIYGDILNDGTIGGASDVIGFDIEGASCTLSGSGTFIASRMAKFTTANATTDFHINQDLTLTYTHATNAALYNNQSGSTVFNIILGAGKRLTVPNARINLNGCTLTLKSDVTGTASLIPQLVTNATASNLFVERYISAWTDDAHGWHLLSSPVESQAVDPNFTDPTAADYDFYMWGETTNEWLNQKVGANNITSFVPGTGYLVAYAATSTKQFAGALNTADVTAGNLTLTPASYYSGWNLVGNPFPSAVKWNDGVNWTVPPEIAAIAKVWDEPSAAYVDIAANGMIPAMNGFMVHVESGSPASLTIPAAARVHDATPWYKSGENQLVLMAYDRTGNTAQQLVVGSDPMATEGYDAGFDSRFLAGYAPQFYSLAGDNMLSTNTLPEIGVNTVIELGFVKNQASEFSIGLAPESLMQGATIYLTDTKTGAVTELREGVEYTFTSAEGDEANRFLLHFGPLGIDDPAADQHFNIFAHSGNIYIQSQQPAKAEVMVTNLQGQMVLGGQAGGNSLTVLNARSLPAGIYFVMVTGTDSRVGRKVMLGR